MNRTLASLASGAAAVAACALLLAACGRQQPTQVASRGVGASTVITGDGGVIEDPPPGEIAEAIVTLETGAGATSYMTRNELTHVASLSINGKEFHLVQSSAYAGATELIAALEGDLETVSAEPNYDTSNPEAGGQPMSFDDGDGTANATGYLEQFAVDQVHVEEAHAIAQGAGVRVGIIDTGIHDGHLVFASITIIHGINSSVQPNNTDIADVRTLEDEDGDGNQDGGYGHGTHIAGIVHLVAPQATLVIEKVLNDEGRGDAFGLAQGMIDAIDVHGVSVLNMSLGMTAQSEIVEAAVIYARERDIAVICSAGNAGSSTQLQYPASYADAFSVTAVDGTDRLAGFANRNAAVDASAPGVNIISTHPWANMGWTGYAVGSGTSMAAPWLSGVTALVLSANGSFTGWEAAHHAKEAATPIGHLNGKYAAYMGRGRVDAYVAVSTAGGPLP